MRENWITLLCGTTAAILVVFSLTSIGVDIGTIMHMNTRYHSGEDLLGLHDASIEKALTNVKVSEPFSLPADMSSPFRIAGYPRRPKRTAPAGPRYERVTLRLKGILAKDNSLAIIENQTGKSFICREGDTIGEQTVEKIGAEQVVMKDKLGTYEIAVS
ncbi:MAG: hypothetical protein ACOCW2_02880, partial [Chitinivibrionales bacterium]